ncbi:MAG: hypothetical protein AAF721_06155 [Myxococcota bacterium]
MNRYVFPTFALLAACKPQASVAPASEPNAEAGEPAVVAPPDTTQRGQVADPPPTAVLPEPDRGAPPSRPEDAALVLRPADTTVPSGHLASIEVFNAGDDAFRFHHPGGNSGCAAFRWVVFLTANDGTRWSNEIPARQRACTSVMVMPRDYEFAAGEVAGTVKIDTARNFYVHAEPSHDKKPAPGDQTGVALPVGRYELAITGAGLELRGTLTVTR